MRAASLRKFRRLSRLLPKVREVREIADSLSFIWAHYFLLLSLQIYFPQRLLEKCLASIT